MNKILEEIAKDKLNIPTLEMRGSDRLDFHDLSVWQIRAAMVEAYLAGQNEKCARTDIRLSDDSELTD
jgi:hypothetical protein